jgi:hypothetical protein
MSTCKQRVDKPRDYSFDVPETIRSKPAWIRLEDQLSWYDKSSVKNHRWSNILKIFQTVLALLIPILNLLTDNVKWVTAGAGTLIAFLEAIQQLRQYSTLWVTYRSTAENLKHEKFLFLSAAGPYRGLSEPERLIQLSERVEERVSTENANWFRDTQRVITPQKKESV